MSDSPQSGRGGGEPGGRRTWRAGTLVYTAPGLVALFFWLIGGDFLENFRERGLGPVVQLMLKRLEASNFFVGLLLGSIPAGLGMVLAPVVSMMSDRHRGRWGRRIPFIAAPLPFVVLTMTGLAFTPALGGVVHEWLGPASPGRNACALAVFCVLWTLYDIASVVMGAVFGGLVNDVVPRELLGRFFGLFRASSLIAGILFNYFILEHAESLYFWLLLVMAALTGIGYGAIALKVREGEYPPPPPLAAGPRPAFLAGLAVYVRECFTQPFYLLFFVMRAFGMLAFGPLNSFVIFYVKEIGVDLGVYGKFTALTYVISLCVTYPLGALADRLHPLRLGIATLALYVAVALGGWFFAGSQGPFLFFYVAHGVVSGAFMTGTASLQQRILPPDRFAQFASAGGILGSLAFMAMPPLAGLVLDLTGKNYRFTFLMSGALAAAALALFVLFFRAWKRRGGDAEYTAP